MPINRNSQPKEKMDQAMEFYTTEPEYTFEDVILPEKVVDEIMLTINLLKYDSIIYDEWGLGSVFRKKKNISINIYGPSGTGKTMAAYAIASYLRKKALLVNYAEIESKYVGETAKNLVRLFEYSIKHDVVIVFDEADALLSKRVTSMHSSTDVSVNQTRNVLLHILDEFNGIVIFTTNFIRNYDNAFMRRITSHIKFELPDEEQREKLWEHYLVPGLPISEDRESLIKNLKLINRVTGADIANAVLKAAVRKASDNAVMINLELLTSEINNIIASRKSNDSISDEEYSITTKTVSEEYVKKQVEEGGIIS